MVTSFARAVSFESSGHGRFVRKLRLLLRAADDRPAQRDSFLNLFLARRGVASQLRNRNRNASVPALTNGFLCAV